MVLSRALEMSLDFIIFIFFKYKKSRIAFQLFGINLLIIIFKKYYLKEALEPPTAKIANILVFCPAENMYIPLSSV